MRVVVKSHTFDPGWNEPHVRVELYVQKDRCLDGHEASLGGEFTIKASLADAATKYPLGRRFDFELTKLA